MKRYGSIVLVLMVVMVFGMSGLRAQEKKDTSQAIFESKCGLCHNLDRAKSKKKTAPEWEVTVLRMKSAHGSRINDDETKAIIGYLAENYGK
jgi:hypothetical protein